MLDRTALRLLKPALDRAGGALVRLGIGADAITLAGFVIGMAAALVIAFGSTFIGLALLWVSRLCDGLDGAVARLTQPTDRGAFLDITLDFLFYASIPLAFAILEPASNALPAAILLASFIGTGSSFLAFAVFAERRGLHSAAYPNKGIYYLGGLTEGGETLFLFSLMCLLPAWFDVLALFFSALCALTIVTRIVGGWRLLKG